MPTTTTKSERLTRGDLEAFDASLTTKRDELLALYRHDVRSGQESNDESADDFVDRANNSYNRELMFSLSDAERELLIQVEDALGRLAAASFGDCTHCGQAIGMPRLRAVPWARFCIDCQEQEEMGLLGR